MAVRIMLYEHQEKIVDEFPHKCALIWSTGTGKSRAALELAKKAGERTLIICPKSIKTQWQQQVDDDTTIQQHVAVMTKEEFRRDWKKLGEYPAVIVDEAHFFFGMKSQLRKALKGYFKRWGVEYRWLLTATPYRSSPWDVYVMCDHLDQPLDYWKFERMFFYRIKMGRREVPVVKNGIENQIAELVARVSDIVRLDDCTDVPEQTEYVEHFEMNEKQLRAFSKVEDFNPVVVFTKKHQAENGFIKYDDYSDIEHFPTDKTDRICDLVQENDKTAVVCRYRQQIQHLKEKLEKNNNVFVIHGDVKDRHEVVQTANDAQRAIVLIQADCAEGYELPNINTVIFASLSFSYVAYKQMKGRFLRINNMTKNVFIHLVTKKGVDDGVYDSVVNKKQQFDISVYAKTNTPRE